MAQHDYVISNAGGAVVRADINDALQAILSSNSGASAPTVTKPFMLWFDTTASLLKIRNAADTAWVLYSDFVLPADGAVIAAKLATGAAVANIGYTPANDSAVVHTSGNETIAGNKTFSGTTRLGTVTDGTNSTSATNAIMGSAKAWVNFNGVTTTTIRASYNVSSVTRNAAGDYTVNFTNTLADANYSYAISAETVSGLNRLGSGSDATAPSTTAFRFIVLQAGGSVADTARACVTIFR